MKSHQHKVRYAVVGLGWIAQDVVIPAFANAKENSMVSAIVSDDPVKLAKVGDKYGIQFRYSYSEYGRCLTSGNIDAVYIALPNSLHCAYAVQAARAGIHVLCEKPMAMTEEECRLMIREARLNHVKLMVAYRLHFEEGNLRAIDIAQSQRIGKARIFSSAFTMTVERDNVRSNRRLTGGSLYDVGIYCINAARNIFQSEPTTVTGIVSGGANNEIAAALLKFPHDRVALLTSSFAVSVTSMYEVIGTQGSLRVEPAYHHKGPIIHELKIGGKKQRTVFAPRDQFGPQIVYFSRCIMNNVQPEPSGEEGQADVRIIEAIYRSAKINEAVRLRAFHRDQWPTLRQSRRFPQTAPAKLVHARAPEI